MVTRKTIGIPVFPGVDLLDVTGPLEVLASDSLEVITIAPTPRSSLVQSHPKLHFKTDYGLADAPSLDVLIVPGGPGLDLVLGNKTYRDWLVARADKAEWMVSICAGALLLAAAGLLDGHRATTHWASLKLLRMFDKIHVVPGRDSRSYPSYVFSEIGGEKRATSAGVTAGLDLALALRERLTGTQSGRSTELLLQYDPEPPFGTGNPAKADPETRRLVCESLKEMIARREQIIRDLIGPRDSRYG